MLLRSKAAAALEHLGGQAGPALRNVLAGSPSAELRQRVVKLLRAIDSPAASGETLRAVRAVEVLEVINSPDARAVLRRLAAGPAEDRMTQTAQAALARLTP